MNKKGYLGIIGVLAVLCILLALIGKMNPDAPTPPSPSQPPPPDPNYDQKLLQAAWPKIIAAAVAPAEGNPSAPYTIVECGDFQCPNCGKAEPILDHLITHSKGNVKMYFDNFPLPNAHPHAVEAAQAGISAAAQGKFWPMYHMLYSHQDDLIDSEIEYYAAKIPGFKVAQLASDLKTQRYVTKLKNQTEVLNDIKLSSTPTLFLRKGNGPIEVYLGTRGDKTYKGVQALDDAPPWFPPPAHPVVHPNPGPQVPGASDND